MLRPRRGHLLRDWIQKAELGDPDAIGVFAGSVRQDLHAVTAGLTLLYSSGMVEGHVNRIKTIKRQMYGRASFACSEPASFLGHSRRPRQTAAAGVSPRPMMHLARGGEDDGHEHRTGCHGVRECRGGAWPALGLAMVTHVAFHVLPRHGH
ncbi:transposase [Streptomyces virginiae]|uniref:transposase n=1 Tax=Streptomyces virginiae TaxID=1961 RepID=UPI0035E11F10